MGGGGSRNTEYSSSSVLWTDQSGTVQRTSPGTRVGRERAPLATYVTTSVTRMRPSVSARGHGGSRPDGHKGQEITLVSKVYA